ncbi:MAG: lipoyl(octanoyl) transferase LipB [Actinobacteria bacterium]|nr:lipoyl(octanoyl) transferase LipB [Actinomycetota bacterium]
MTLRVRWLGRVGYDEAQVLQRSLAASRADDHLLLLEHPPVYTLGVRADVGDVLVPPASVGADLVRTDRGGQVTYHGPGQLVGYPVVTVPGRRGGGLADTRAHVHSLEQLLIDVLCDLGLRGAGRDERHPGVWVGGAKICAVGVRLARGRSTHGFALNVDPDLSMFDHIVPCGIRDADKDVTSLAAQGVPATMRQVVDAVARRLIADAGYGDHFIHRTGHGIGLEEHEDPYLVAGNPEPLAPGHAFSVEPGIYLDGRFGARIEDIVVATAAGPQPLNHAPHGLAVVEV